MGPRARARGNQVTTYAMLHAPWLQWGHERALVEIVIYVVARMNGCSASMGPRARARGNRLRGQNANRLRLASMGPRARARGNKKYWLDGSVAPELQWGHERALVEIQPHRGPERRIAALQWGHERALVEIPEPITTAPGMFQLQWGHERALVAI